MKKVSEDYLYDTATRAHRLVEIDTKLNRAILTLNGEVFYADILPIGEPTQDEVPC